MHLRLLAIATISAALVGPGLDQAPTARRQFTTLYDYLAKMPWNVAQAGPLVAVTPMIAQESASLNAFGRKTVVLGGLTAVVPQRTTVVNSKFTQPPNLYEGLPQEKKVLYLLRSLDAAQWQKATRDGLSIADCRGEQALVFDSILPDPFRYAIGTVESPDSIAGGRTPEDEKSLAGDERRSIRLRIVRHVELTLPLQGDDGFTGGSVEDWKKGQRVALVREEKKDEFGHRILTDAPNLARPSALDLRDARLGAAIPFQKGESVESLLARISAATKVRIVADPHYANLRMFESGTSAAARDLLAALSLGVAGTYRRIGDAYVLTNDLEGMAAHQARIAAWEDAIKKEIDERERTWRKEIVQGGNFGRIGFRSPVYDGLTDAERANLEANDRPGGRDNVYMAVADASPAVRESVMRGASGLQTNKEKVGVHSSIRYEIVLPDGSTTAWGGWLGSTEQFSDKPYQPNRSRPSVPTPLAPTARLQGLILHADTPEEAKAQIERVARIGADAVKISNLWLETASPETLAAAVAVGNIKSVKVSLVVRPWTTGPENGPRDPDRTVVGAHGKGLAAQKAGLGPWNEYWNDATAFPPATPERLAPLDPLVATRRAALARLAATKGLASVVALDLYGIGYAKASGNSYGSYYYTPPLENVLSYGYSDAQRLAFFQKEGLDPLDVENPMVDTGVDLRDAWGDAAWGNDGAFAKWQAARGGWARAAALDLARALAAADSGRPVLMVPQPPTANVPPFVARYVMRWNPREDVPTAPVDFQGADVEAASAFKIIELRDDANAEFRNRLAWLLNKHFGAEGTPVVLDLSSVPGARLDVVLARWLK